VTTAEPGIGPSPESGAAGGPTVLRMLLGAQLRRLRESKGITRETAGWEIRASESKISRMELGRVSFKERDIVDLLTLYGVSDDAEREALLSLAREANAPNWWQRYTDVLPNWFQPFLGLEAAAELIRTYEVQFVPGLLQTRDYARAVLSLAPDNPSGEDVDRRVAVRLGRQQILTRPDAPALWAVVDEAVLRRPVGGTEAMRMQIEALIEASKLPNVTVQVIPFSAGGHSAAGGAFTILRFPDQGLPDVVYLEQITTALYLDKRDDVEAYAVAMSRLCVEAEPPARTVKILEGILRDL